MAGNPRLYSLPNDEHLRTVVWTGRINAQSAEFKTARFTAWLRRIDETGSFVDDRVDEVVESIGAITLFPIGACFRRQQRVRRVDEAPPVILSLKVPERWEVRRAIDKKPDTDQFLISPRDLPLKLKSRGGEDVSAFEAYLVVAETLGGTTVLIPCGEVYRAFFAGSSALANSHFRLPWSKARKDFVEKSEESLDVDGRRLWHIDLVEHVPPSIARDLCWLEFVRGAAKIADQTHASIVNQLQARRQPWLRAAPPISEGILRIQAQTTRLPRSGATLVTQIRDFKSDVRVAKITCTVAERVIPSPPDPGKDGPKVPGEKPKRKPSAIARPGDKKNTKGFFDLSGNPVDWRGLPRPEVTPRRTRGDGGGGPPRKSEKEAQVPVSVGEPSNKDGTRPAAQLTPTDVERLANRFQEVITTLDQLVTSGGITSWDYLPIYNPVQEMYCSFPELAGTADQLRAARWCRVEGHIRVALVLQLHIKERTVYWIEIEPVPRGYKGLAVETLDGLPIDELIVSNLLEACAFSAGVWNESLENSARPLLLTAERHDQLKGGRLSPNMFLRALIRLDAKRAQYENGVVDESSGTIGALTEHVSPNAAVPF